MQQTKSCWVPLLIVPRLRNGRSFARSENRHYTEGSVVGTICGDSPSMTPALPPAAHNKGRLSRSTGRWCMTSLILVYRVHMA